MAVDVVLSIATTRRSAKVWAMTETAVALVQVADRLAVAVVEAPMLVDSILTAQTKVDQEVALDLLPAQMDKCLAAADAEAIC